MGIFVGITAVLYTARANSGQPNGTDLTFDTIIAAVLGGTGVVGGAGTIIGTVAGAMVVGIINNVMNLAGVSPFYQNIVKGIINLRGNSDRQGYKRYNYEGKVKNMR